MRFHTKILVVQPTAFCNAACSYCYLQNRDDRRVMAAETVDLIGRHIVAQLDDHADTLVVWHGGEPTVAPLNWYKDATKLFRANKSGRPLRFCLQTNGTLLDDSWAAFLAESGTEVGLSLDGPEDLHDLHRRTRGGKGTWRAAMDALDRLRRHGVEPGIIAVVTEASLSRGQELVDFFVAHEIDTVSFNTEEIEGANLASSLEVGDAPSRVEQFYVDVLSTITGRRHRLFVREAERILTLLGTGASAADSNEQVQPAMLITVDRDGGLYSFSPEFTEHVDASPVPLKLGHVRQHSLTDLASGDAIKALHAAISTGVETCRRECAYWRLCGGGAPVNRLAESGRLDLAETLFCRTTVQAMARALHRVVTPASSWEQRR